MKRKEQRIVEEKKKRRKELNRRKREDEKVGKRDRRIMLEEMGRWIGEGEIKRREREIEK